MAQAPSPRRPTVDGRHACQDGPVRVNRHWLETMTRPSNANRGLVVISEDEGEAAARGEKKLATS